MVFALVTTACRGQARDNVKILPGPNSRSAGGFRILKCILCPNATTQDHKNPVFICRPDSRCSHSPNSTWNGFGFGGTCWFVYQRWRPLQLSPPCLIIPPSYQLIICTRYALLPAITPARLHTVLLYCALRQDGTGRSQVDQLHHCRAVLPVFLRGS